MLFVEHARHLRLLNPGQAAIGDRYRRRHPQRLTGEAPVREELAGARTITQGTVVGQRGEARARRAASGRFGAGVTNKHAHGTFNLKFSCVS